MHVRHDAPAGGAAHAAPTPARAALGGTPPALGDGGADGDDSAALLGSFEGELGAPRWLAVGGMAASTSGVAATRWRPSGFKRSVEKKLLDLAPMPTNLHLAVLEVADDDGLRGCCRR